MKDIRATHVEMKPESRGKLVAAIVIGLAVIAGVTYTYTAGWWNAPPKPVVSAGQLPQLTPPLLPDKPKPI